MTVLRVEYYNHIKDYTHPNLHTFILSITEMEI